MKASAAERNLLVTSRQPLGHAPYSGLGPWVRCEHSDWYDTVDDTEEYTAMDWRHRALCRDEDPELFFPIGTTGPAVVQIEQAKAVCRRCPVVQSCLDWALTSGQDSGVWGGLSEDERRALKRRTARTRVHTA